MAADVVCGIDSGGTWLRIAAATPGGGIVETQRRQGGRREHGHDVTGALSDMLEHIGSRYRIVGGVSTNAAGITEGWQAHTDAPLRTRSEAVIAAEDRHLGVVLIAGTGSAAATITDGTETHVTGAAGIKDDVGSAVWIGRQAIAAAITARSGGTPTAVADVFGGEIDLDALGDASTRSGTHLQQIGLLAPHVSAAARAGDHVANRICERAATLLLGLLADHVDTLGETRNLITVGSVLGANTPVGGRVRRALPATITSTHLDDLTRAATTAALREWGEHPH